MQRFYKTFALAALMLVAMIGTAFAGPQDFNLINNTFVNCDRTNPEIPIALIMSFL